MAVNREQNLRFVTIMVAFTGVVLAVYHDNALGVLLAPVTTATARLTLAVLQWFNIDAACLATVLSHPGGFAYDISYRCTGVLPAAFLVVAILAYPASPRRKCAGLALGVPALIGLNLARLVHLFYLGVYHRTMFDVAHAVLWEGILISAIFGLWFGWTRWADC